MARLLIGRAEGGKRRYGSDRGVHRQHPCGCRCIGCHLRDRLGEFQQCAPASAKCLRHCQPPQPCGPQGLLGRTREDALRTGGGVGQWCPRQFERMSGRIIEPSLGTQLFNRAAARLEQASHGVALRECGLGCRLREGVACRPPEGGANPMGFLGGM